MKNCEYDGCDQQIEEKYHYCYNHFKAGRVTDLNSDRKIPQWHEDPLTDQIMKLNSNCGKIAIYLERIANAMEKKRTFNFNVIKK